jgi:hypothetical protein
MTASESSYFSICGICNKPVKLETSKIDEFGKAVHDGRYLLKVSLPRAITPPPRPKVQQGSEAISYFRNRLERSRPALSVWQFDSVGMLLVALVIVRQNPFEPTSLFFSEPFIDQGRLVIDNELFATAVTPKGSHFLQTHCFLPALTFLYRNCTHLRNVSCLWQRACLGATLLHLMLKNHPPSPIWLQRPTSPKWYRHWLCP